MKIVYIEPAGKGGMIHYAYQLCRALVENGAEVTLLTDDTYELDELKAPFAVEKLLSLWDAKPSGRQSSTAWAVTFRNDKATTIKQV